MSKLTVRFADVEDSAKCAEFMVKTKDNMLDPEVFKNPTTNTLVVEEDGQPQLFFPFQAVLMIESLGVNPELGQMGEAKALNKAYAAVENIARNLGIREIMFQCKDNTLIKFVENRGFEKLECAVMRHKVPAEVQQ